MIRDITIGQYYPSKSFLHSLDPRVKLMGTLIYVLSLFLFRGPAGLAAVTLGLIALVWLSHVPFRYMVKGLKAIWVILIMTAMFNLFRTPGEPVVSFWIFRITEEGLKSAGFMVVRLSFLILGSSVLTLTTTPNQLTDGLEKALRPLNKIRIPVHEIAMIMSIALRFIPVLIEETDKIMKAQLARGADFESGNLIRRIKAMVPLLVPLFISAFRRANDLALAMEARCYQGGEGRTKMNPLKYTGRDGAAYLVIAGYFTGVILLRILL